MSKIETVVQTRNQLITNYDIEKLQLGENEHVSATYTDSGSGSTLEAGLLMGQVSATGKIVELDPTASNGSQYLFGILFLGLNESVTVAAGADLVATLINKGRVNENKIVLPSGVTLDTIISGDGRTVRQYANALGLILESGVEITKVDNQ